MAVQSRLDRAAVTRHCDSTWEEEILPQLTEYIRIPNKSPLFDPAWQQHGHMDRAVAQIEAWCRARAVRGLTVEVVRLPGRTPLIFMEVPAFPEPAAATESAVLLYGHLDKQPEMTGWREGLGPWIPLREGDRLYGRGGADDGYSAFASLTAIEAVQRHGGSHRRLVIVIEACEESGSPDLPHYIQHLAPRIGEVDLVICLDSGCGDYERLWSTTSLRGMVAGDLRVDVLTEGVHSGDASGVVPSSFRVLRQLLDRIEDAATGRILLEEFHVAIPAQRVEQARVAATVLGEAVSGKFPFVPGVQPMAADLAERILNRTWRPTLSVTGAGGLPALQDAGNVLRPFTALKLSLRLPPTAHAARAVAQLQQTLEADPPQGARVSFKAEKGSAGWNAPALAPWLEESVDGASRAFFGNPPAYMGEGGSIPFMGMLGEKFPAAQFLITGVLGPASNAHGPNEFLHVPTGKALTACVAQVLADHARR
jgi:acetylornithine deacetylase/succinyl-diaminopimelate desuccinylase-like protein